MKRIAKICSFLDKCTSFTDVACDHGYCTLYMLEKGLCERAVVSDISDKCLSKARGLLFKYIAEGMCEAVCCDGLEGIDENTEQVLIAGIGGEEIIKILKNAYIPRGFVFQPMKNAEGLRAYLLENNCEIAYDGIFRDGKKYYFLIKGKRGGKREKYTPAQLKYGRDSFSNPEFYSFLKQELAKKQSYLISGMTEENRALIQQEAQFIKGVLSGEIK